MFVSRILAFALSGYLVVVNGWALDDSCNEISDFLHDTVSKLFQKASKAVYQMTLSELGQGDPHVEELSRILFGQKPQHVSAALFKLQSLDRISTFRPGAIGSDLSFEDFKLYCDFSRLERRADEEKNGQLYDPEMLTGMRKKDINDCKSKNLIDKTYAFSNVVTKVGDKDRAGRATAIQICQDSLKTVLNKRYRTLLDLRKEVWPHAGQKKPASVLNRLKGRAEIDSLTLLDFTILHEIMHAHFGITADGKSGSADDLDHNGGHGASNGFRWEGCANNPFGSRNAESLAFMVLGVELIKVHSLRVKEDGSLETIT